MTKTEIKKALYKEKPEARLLHINENGAHYETSLEDGSVIYFIVPTSEMGITPFYSTMDAKSLNRWLTDE